MKLTGYPGLVEGQVGIRYSKGRGWQTVRTWYGLFPQAKALAGELVRLGATDVDCPPPANDKLVGTVTASFGGADDATPPENRIESTWELDELESDVSTWKHPRMRLLFAAYAIEDMIRIKAATDAILRGEQPTVLSELDDPARALISTLMAPGVSADFTQFVSRQLKADLQDTFYDPTNLLRHTLSGPQGWKYSFIWDHVATLISSAEIQASEPDLWFDLPPNRWWLFRKPRITQRSNGILDVTREWQEVEYDAWKYNLMSSIT